MVDLRSGTSLFQLIDKKNFDRLAKKWEVEPVNHFV